MDAERWQRIDGVVQAALELDPLERTVFLDSACPDDEFRLEVERLIVEAERTDSFLERPALGVLEAAGDGSPPDANAPLQVGPYRIVKRLGAGGMGSVFLAERADEEYQHQVAIKLLHASWPSESLIRRFRVERQILASLHHKNIATLLDGGSTEEGQPYLVMEFVDGRPIDEYCNQERLPIRQRLELFTNVCMAVRHAHRNLVVHRDLKPSNILVNGEGTPKLLDFGIAKLLDRTSLPATAEMTRTAMRPMSLAYASPEQIRGQTITTASDIYSLGILLYKMLTGRLPRNPRALNLDSLFRGFAEAPTLPSVAVIGDRSGAVEAAHFALRDRRQLSRALRGDLDNIVLKAMAEQPEQRYGTVSELAEDIRRAVTGEPVRARPHTLVYRASRFVRRNKMGTAAAATLLLLILGFTLTAYMQSREIALQRDNAERQSREAAQQRDKAEQVVKFMVGIFGVAEPSRERVNEITARQVLERGLEKSEHELADQPEVRATVLQTVGRIYSNLGDYQEAMKLLLRAQDLRQGEASATPSEQVVLLIDIGTTAADLGEFDAAVEALDKAIAIGRVELDEDHLDLAKAMLWRGQLAIVLGETDEALELLQPAFEHMKKELGPLHHDLVTPATLIGDVHHERADFDTAEEFFDQAIRIIDSQDKPNLVEKGTCLARVSLVRRDQGRLASAAAFLEQTVALYEEALEPDHPHLASALNTLGATYREAGELQRAEVFLRRGLEIKRKTEEELSPSYASALNNLAGLLFVQGELTDAQELWQRVLEIVDATLGREHRYYGQTLMWLAKVEHARGDSQTALKGLEEARKILESALGSEHIQVGRTLLAQGEVELSLGSLSRAEEMVRRALEIYRGVPGVDNGELATVNHALGNVFLAEERYNDAHLAFEQSMALWEDVAPGETNPRTVEQRADLLCSKGDLAQNLGHLKAAQSSWAEALRLLDGNPEGSVGAYHREIRAKILVRLARGDEAQLVVSALTRGGWKASELP